MQKANGYATKADLKKLESNLRGEMKDMEKNIKSEMLDLKVEVLGELKKMQEDNATHTFSHMRINDEIQELQKK